MFQHGGANELVTKSEHKRSIIHNDSFANPNLRQNLPIETILRRKKFNNLNLQKKNTSLSGVVKAFPLLSDESMPDNYEERKNEMHSDIDFSPKNLRQYKHVNQLSESENFSDIEAHK